MISQDEAFRVQDELRARLVIPSEPVAVPPTVVGLDVTYEVGSDRAVAAAVVVDVATLAVVEVAAFAGTTDFPYVPGLLAFREVPLLTAAIERLTTTPELLVCDGYGLAHPRRFGLASHLGTLLDLPSYGVAKTPYVGTFDPPGPGRGDSSDLIDSGAVVGRVVRTREGVKPVFVSAGHRVGLADCAALTVRLSGRYRIPEPTRQADIESRRILREWQ
ncbi:endonuclease V [Actinoplanes bogorensis]|uniref:Endonuclease V n=1 Tax=Paractinoplanes bogorensis TaxID=1610840 RepID=A0ABS5YP48_9ACTN|nr:endonuclease V [Actinoplanes bogorensis]MBU2665153.1 endonuclease V [Actinoplanes bogorensis]